MVSVLGISQRKAFKIFAVVAAVAPITGVLFGGIIFDRCGGYNSYKSLHVLQIVGVLAFTTGFGGAFANSSFPFAFMLFLQLFAGGMVMPASTGLMLNQVPQNMRTVCNSVANISYNLFGYVPAPYIYGYMYERYGGKQTHAGLFTIEFFGFLSFVFSMLMFIKKRKDFHDYLEEKKKNLCDWQYSCVYR